MYICTWYLLCHIQQLHYPCEVVGRCGNRQRHKGGSRIILMRRKDTRKIYASARFLVLVVSLLLTLYMTVNTL